MAISAISRVRGSRRIEDQPEIGPDSQRRCRALSIVTVEELGAAYRAAPDAVAAALPGVPFDALFERHADAMFVAGGRVTRRVDAGFGAVPPRGEEFPPVISTEWFEDFVARVDEPPAALPVRDAPFAADGGADAAEGGPQVDPGEAIVYLVGNMLPIRSQGERSTCVAHSVGALLEQRVHPADGPFRSVGPQFLYWSAKEVDGRHDLEGTSIRVCLQQAAAAGFTEEATWPYVADIVQGNEGQGPPPAGVQDAARQTLSPAGRSVGTYKQPHGLTNLTILDELAKGTPVAFSVVTPPVIWHDNDQVWDTGFIPMPFPESDTKHAHALLAVGYGQDEDIAGKTYIVFRNSWGERFAPNNPFGAGYGIIPLAYLTEWGGEAYVV